MSMDGIIGLHHVAILCSDRDASVRFYEALGFHEYESHVRPERKDEVIFMEQHGVVLELFVSLGNPQRVSAPEAYGLRHLALSVSDAQSARLTLMVAGYEPESIRVDTFNGKKLFFVKDPDGLPIELHE